MGGHFEEKLQEHLDEGKDLLSVGPGDSGDFVGGLVALAANVVEPGLATGWNEVL